MSLARRQANQISPVTVANASAPPNDPAASMSAKSSTAAMSAIVAVPPGLHVVQALRASGERPGELRVVGHELAFELPQRPPLVIAEHGAPPHIGPLDRHGGFAHDTTWPHHASTVDPDGTGPTGELHPGGLAGARQPHNRTAADTTPPTARDRGSAAPRPTDAKPERTSVGVSSAGPRQAAPPKSAEGVRCRRRMGTAAWWLTSSAPRSSAWCGHRTGRPFRSAVPTPRDHRIRAQLRENQEARR